jgi:hypothetical protein
VGSGGWVSSAFIFSQTVGKMASFSDDIKFKEMVAAAEENAALLRSNCTSSNKNQHGENWTLSYSKPKLNLDVYYSTEPDSSLTRFMAKCLFNDCKAAELIQVLYDLERRMTWDVNCSHVQSHPLYDWKVEGAADDCPNNLLHVFLCETNAVGPISARDFVDINYLSHQVDEHGNVLSATSAGGHTSALTAIITENYADIFPEKKGYVRGVSSSGSGWYAVQQGTNVLMYYVIHSDLKGYFPSWLANNTVGGTYVQFFTAVKNSIQKDGF